MIEEIRHSIFALRGLPPSVGLAVRVVYYDAIKLAFFASTTFAALAACAALVANGSKLERTCPETKREMDDESSLE